ncbi:MAG TPA: hypothetical protein VHS96_18845, partial [Bacteroidia bacterium]|nr:hypothetical protein [Bacteroidia bacterium]
WYKPENRDWIKSTLRKAGREDLAQRLLDEPKAQEKTAPKGKMGVPVKGANVKKGKAPTGKRIGKTRPENVKTKAGGGAPRKRG